MYRNRWTPSVLLLMLLAVPGPAMAQAPEARIRVIHLSADAPAVDVHVNEGAEAVASALAFGQSTAWMAVPAATYSFDVVPSGAGVADAVLSIDGLSLEAAKAYSAVAYGAVSSLQPMALEDDLSPPAEGQIRVRAVHAAPAVGQVDIWNIPASGDPGLLYENVDFGVAGAYLDLPTGAYTLGFDANDDATPDLVFALPALPSGAVATVFAVSAGEQVFLMAQLNDGEPIRIDPSTP